jgi:hypothetical protein
MSDTPRTDEQDGYLGEGAVDSDFARQLERELSAKDQQLSALRLVCGTTDANKFETALDRANARIAELEKDKARLDWLDKNCTRVADSERYLPTSVYWGGGTHRDARQAIDAAMRGTQP